MHVWYTSTVLKDHARIMFEYRVDQNLESLISILLVSLIMGLIDV